MKLDDYLDSADVKRVYSVYMFTGIIDPKCLEQFQVRDENDRIWIRPLKKSDQNTSRYGSDLIKSALNSVCYK